MTDTDNEEVVVESSGAVLLSLGEAFCPDLDLLDPAVEGQGVLMVQQSEDGSLWRLMGRGEGIAYTQDWERIGNEPGKKPKLRTVQ
jgi:hypothetical protein